MHVLQVNNVMAIGGTAACARATAEAFRDQQDDGFRHTILLAGAGRLRDDVIAQWFPDSDIGRVSEGLDAIRARKPDLIVLNNTSAAAWPWPPAALDCPVVAWVHSPRMRIAAGTVTAYNSRWCAAASGADGPVLYQTYVPCPNAIAFRLPTTNLHAIVGRVGTPGNPSKYPSDDGDLVGQLLTAMPNVMVEHVGPPHRWGLEHDRFKIVPYTAFPERHCYPRWHAVICRSAAGVTESFGRIALEAAAAGCVPVTDGRGGYLEQDYCMHAHTPAGFVERVGQALDATAWHVLSGICWRTARELYGPRAFRHRMLGLAGLL